MIEIALLGPVAVAIDGDPLQGEAAQRKRLAVLSLLALPPLAPVPRERLLAYVWPDRSGESGRHLLSASVHVLRKALGPEVMVSQGDQLALDPSRVHIDVVAFEAAVDRGDWAEAVALYGGPFLDGFNPGGSPELDQWIDANRSRLERTYGEALRQVAEARASAGDLAAAVDAWQRLAALDPYDADRALGLMRALAAAGNRAAAIQHARIHAHLLDSEFGAAPDPDVVALAEAMRASPESGTERTDASIPMEEATQSVADTVADTSADSVADTVADTVIGPPADPAPGPARPIGSPALVPRPTSERTVPGSRPPWKVANPGHRRVAGLVLGVVLAAAVLAALAVDRSSREAEPAAGIPAIAILPFAMPGDMEADRYLGDGIAEQVLDELGHVEELRVVARASSFAYRDRDVDVREVGRALGVTHVLEGSIARSGGTVRIWVQLVEAAATGYHVWSQTYDRPATELFALQDEIAREVARALEVQLGPGARSEHRPSLEAFDLYLQGRHAWLRRSRRSLEEALGLFRRATALDSLYAPAWVGLADSYAMLGSYDYGGLAPTDAYEEARTAVKRALRLDPDLASAHAALATIHMNYDWDWAAAEREFLRAIEINPGYAQARQWYALLLLAGGRDTEATRQLQKAAELDPASPVMLVTRSRAHFYRRDWARAREEAEAALRLDPAFSRAHLLLALLDLQTGQPEAAAARARALADAGGWEPIVAGVLCHALAASGDTARARVVREEMVTESRRRYVPAEAFAIAWIGLGDPERAIASLERAYDQRSGGIVYLAVEPLADPLRDHARFQRLLARRPS